MEFKQTRRGFTYYEFTNSRGELCNIQDSSSIACEGDEEGWHIWLGHADLEVKVFKPYKGWMDVDFEALYPEHDIIGNNRMHLSQKQVRELLPMLQYFAEHGNLPTEDEFNEMEK